MGKWEEEVERTVFFMQGEIHRYSILSVGLIIPPTLPIE